MKREWIGFGLLLGLLILGLLVTRYMDKTHQTMAEKLESAGALALAEDWDGAGRLIRKVRQDWEDTWHLSAALTDHGPMEEIDSLFAQLKIYERQRERLPFAAICTQISSYLEDLGDAHALNWWNVL